MSKKLTLGLFGFGVVGQGLYDIISSKELNLDIRRIVIRDSSKSRSLPAELFSTHADDILDDTEIDTVVELINDSAAAYRIVKKALQNGKNVVSASKKMIAEHLEELVELQQKYNVSLLYEGAVCGSIPIIRNLEEYYDNELLHSISGIFNGSSNYILSKIANEGLDYSDALAQAQDLGFAETDPTSDVGGYDAKYKLLIAAAHAYGIFAQPDDIFNLGIQNFSPADLQFAQNNGLKIKLVPSAQKLSESQISLFVLPKLVPATDFLYNVENEYNAVSVKAAFADQQLFYGKGAGGHPTGAAVLSDITALRYGYRYEYKKYLNNTGLTIQENPVIRVYIRTNNPSLLDSLSLENVVIRYEEGDQQFVIAAVNLSSLRLNHDALTSEGTFIAEASALFDAGSGSLKEGLLLSEAAGV